LFTSVAIVGLNFLARSEHLFQSVSKDLEVGPLATGERSMEPDNISCLSTNSDLVAQSSSPELVGEPLLVEQLWLVDTEVGAVNCYLAGLALITPESIAPANLKERSEGKDDEHAMKLHFFWAWLHTTKGAMLAIIGRRCHTHLRNVFRLVLTRVESAISVP
jgi:hypothetical protein